MPHASTWFDHLTTQPPGGSRAAQTTSPQRKRRNLPDDRDADEDADEIAIQSERMSIKCPLTLQPFIDPVTSIKCSHSFERTAIENVLSRSRATTVVSDQSGSRNVRCVECPVCSDKITKGDLRSDPVLVSRVKRLTRLAEMEEEGDGEDDEDDEQDESIVVGKSISRRKNHKLERMKLEEARSPTRERSMVPDTQYDAVDDGESASESNTSTQES